MVTPSPSIEMYACMTPNVLKVMFMLGELEMDFTIHHVRIYQGDNFADGFDALHPYRKVPVLIDHDGPEGTTHQVFESGAILIYLAEKTGKLFGSNAAERSTVMQWLMLQMSSVGPAFGNATHFNRAAPSDGTYARDRFITQAARLCALYNDRLCQSPFLAGDYLSIADIATFPWLWRHPGMIGLDTSGYEGLNRWITHITNRPGFQRIHAQYRELVRIDSADAANADPAIMDRLMGRGDWAFR